MPAPDYFVFDGDPSNSIAPRIPSVDDLGGAEFEDDLEFPPDPQTFPNAAAENQQELVLAGLAQTAFVLCVTVKFNAGTPVVDGFQTVGTRLTGVSVTDNGAGNTTIGWDPGLLPPRPCGPMLTLNEDVEIDRARAYMSGSNNIVVKTKLGATGTDCGFTVRL